jgi:2-amino-4-hydroxy-6-hydroxymethyldihydropteridine diphosphokinase
VARVAVALGGNLGDRETTLRRALDALGDILTNCRASSFHDTEPVGVPASQARYLNAAAVGETTLAPRDLLEALQAIETRFGRERPYVNAPRTLDLDLILYDARIIDEPDLIVPHPRFRERAFVLDALSEIAADWIDPVSGVSVADLKQRLRT